MSSTFLLYGATGFVGEATARLALQSGLKPVLAGRDAVRLALLASELGVEYRTFALEDAKAIDKALKDMPVVLHCAGPFIHTYKPMVEACLRTGVHYLDLTGEIPVYEAIAALDIEAKSRGVMLLPGIGFDVVPTDCLAMHLKQRLPSATRLTLAFQSIGPAGLPPGTQRTAIELMRFGNRLRRNGRMEVPGREIVTRMIDFGEGPVQATRFTWGDVFTAYYSTGIPNIEDYIVLSESMRRQMSMLDHLRPLFKLEMVRNFLKKRVKPGPTESDRDLTFTNVWGEVQDDRNQKAVARLRGPEAGVIWTARAALAGVKKILAGNVLPGYQTPAMAFGADFVLECEGITREDLI
jgi:short subunit dehydrogenase-like uncharacterized protein